MLLAWKVGMVEIANFLNLSNPIAKGMALLCCFWNM
jgi:hypothetical protein